MKIYPTLLTVHDDLSLSVIHVTFEMMNHTVPCTTKLSKHLNTDVLKGYSNDNQNTN